MFQPRHNKPGVEAWAALAGTFFSALLLVLTAVYAGPLWQNEVNTANLARMPFHEMWRNLQIEIVSTGMAPAVACRKPVWLGGYRRRYP